MRAGGVGEGGAWRGRGWEGCRKVLVLRGVGEGAKKVEKRACFLAGFVRLYVPFSRHGVSRSAGLRAGKHCSLIIEESLNNPGRVLTRKGCDSRKLVPGNINWQLHP